MEILTVEIDRLALAAAERSRSVDSKASFLAVASGIVVSAHLQVVWHMPWYVTVLPLAIAVIALICAAVALRPSKREDLVPRDMILAWMDCELGAFQIERQILRKKAEIETLAKRRLKRRAGVATTGFVLLAIALLLLVVLYSIDTAITP